MAEQLERVNGRPFRKLETSRRDLFEVMERPALRPLPFRRYEFASWKRATVSIDYRVEFERHFYSVPFKHVHQRVECLLDRERDRGLPGRPAGGQPPAVVPPGYTTCPEHMPAAHHAHAGWTPSRLVSWGDGVGEPVGRLVEHILSSRPHPEHGYRACMGLFPPLRIRR